MGLHNLLKLHSFMLAIVYGPERRCISEITYGTSMGGIEEDTRSSDYGLNGFRIG